MPIVVPRTIRYISKVSEISIVGTVWNVDESEGMARQMSDAHSNVTGDNRKIRITCTHTVIVSLHYSAVVMQCYLFVVLYTFKAFKVRTIHVHLNYFHACS